MQLEDFKDKLADAYSDDVDTLLGILEIDIRALLDRLDDEIYSHRECFPWIDFDEMEMAEGELDYGEYEDWQR